MAAKVRGLRAVRATSWTRWLTEEEQKTLAHADEAGDFSSVTVAAAERLARSLAASRALVAALNEALDVAMKGNMRAEGVTCGEAHSTIVAALALKEEEMLDA